MEEFQSVSGYAFTTNEKEECTRRVLRYNELLKEKKILIKRHWPEYNKVIYEGIYEDVTAEDIALFCDHGGVPFGANVFCKNGKFSCTIYTD